MNETRQEILLNARAKCRAHSEIDRLHCALIMNKDNVKPVLPEHA